MTKPYSKRERVFLFTFLFFFLVFPIKNSFSKTPTTNFFGALKEIFAPNEVTEEDSLPIDPLFTGNHKPIDPRQLSKTVHIISEEDIQKSNINTVYEALRNVPGVFIRNAGGLGRATSANIRGATGDQTLVLFDGFLSINSPTLGAADFGNLYTTSIEQIEVVRGSSGVLHGSKAQGGLINIVTKRGGGPSSS